MDLEGIEWGAYYFFQAHQLPTVARILSGVSLLASYPVLVLLLLLSLVWLRMQKRFAAMLYLTGCFLASAILAESLKFLIARPRPNEAGESLFARYSLPSSSAWLSLVLFVGAAFVFSRYWKKPIDKWTLRFVALLLVLVLGFANMYLGHHLLFDVLTGWLGGIVVLLTASLWLADGSEIRE